MWLFIKTNRVKRRTIASEDLRRYAPCLFAENSSEWLWPDMPLASGRATGALQRWAPYQRPLSNTRPPHHQNSVGTCRVRRVAQ